MPERAQRSRSRRRALGWAAAIALLACRAPAEAPSSDASEGPRALQAGSAPGAGGALRYDVSLRCWYVDANGNEKHDDACEEQCIDGTMIAGSPRRLSCNPVAFDVSCSKTKTAGIQECIDAIAATGMGGAVELGQRVYDIRCGIEVRSQPIYLRGSGGSTIICGKDCGADAALKILTNGVTLENLTVACNRGSVACDGIWIGDPATYVRDTTLRNVGVLGDPEDKPGSRQGVGIYHRGLVTTLDRILVKWFGDDIVMSGVAHTGTSNAV